MNAKQVAPNPSVRKRYATVSSLPRRLRNFTILTATVGLLFIGFNAVMLLSDPVRDAFSLGTVLFLFACVPFTKATVRLRRGDEYVEHRFWEFPIIVGLAVSPAYAVALSMGLVYFAFSAWNYLRYPDARTAIPRDFGAVSIAVSVGCYIGTAAPPISYAIGGVAFALVREAFTFAYDLIKTDPRYALYSLRHNAWARLLVAVFLSVAVTLITTLLGPHRQFMIALPVSVLCLYWLIQGRSDAKDQQDSWKHMESISSKFIGELEETKAITIALEEALKLFAAKRAVIVLPSVLSDPGFRYSLETGPGAKVQVSLINPGEAVETPRVSDPYIQVIELTTNDRAFGHMVIEWDDKTPEKRRRTTLSKTFGHSVALSIANTRYTKNISTQAAEAAREAERDPLTGLGNRSMLSERGPALLAESADIHRSCALLLFDLDGFKRINDTLGHAAGDLVLAEVARRIRDTIRRNDLAIRLGGDEFAVLAVDMEMAYDAERLASKITRALIPPIEVENLQLSIESSIGVAMYPTDANDIESLLKVADIALYQAKAVGRGKTVRYSPEYNTNDPESLSLATDLRRAIYSSDELMLHYQPQVNLTTGEVIGVEGLVRWNHPNLGLLYPDRFVHIAERSNLVRAFTLRILEQALADRVLMRERLPDATISVNLSAQNLLDSGLSVDVERLLIKYQVEPSELVLEVTETTTAKDVIAADKVLNDLAALGCHIAMDDFGSGYATMESLRTGTPISEIKIDKGFVQHIDTNARDCTVAGAIIEIAHAWECRVVAEGIENHETYLALRDMNCDVGQGYWMHKPAPLQVILDWVKESTPIDGGSYVPDDLSSRASIHV